MAAHRESLPTCYARSSEADMLSRYTSALTEIFKQVPDKREAHRRSRGVLGDMAVDASVVTDILRRHLSQPEALSRVAPARRMPLTTLGV